MNHPRRFYIILQVQRTSSSSSSGEKDEFPFSSKTLKLRNNVIDVGEIPLAILFVFILSLLLLTSNASLVSKILSYLREDKKRGKKAFLRVQKITSQTWLLYR